MLLAVDKKTNRIISRSCQLTYFAFKKTLDFYGIYLLVTIGFLDLVTGLIHTAQSQLPAAEHQFIFGLESTIH